MITYKFENHNIEFENPNIEIKTDNITIYPSTMEIEVDVFLTVYGAKYGIRLTGVKVQNLTFDGETLTERVMTRLEDYKV